MRRLPILIVSGRTGPGYMDIALKNGASDYFSKPLTLYGASSHSAHFARLNSPLFAVRIALTDAGL